MPLDLVLGGSLGTSVSKARVGKLLRFRSATRLSEAPDISHSTAPTWHTEEGRGHGRCFAAVDAIRVGR